MKTFGRKKLRKKENKTKKKENGEKITEKIYQRHHKKRTEGIFF